MIGVCVRITREGLKAGRAAHVLRDGSESTSLNIATPIDADSFTWQSIHRTLAPLIYSAGIGVSNMTIPKLKLLLRDASVKPAAIPWKESSASGPTGLILAAAERTG